MRDLGILFIDLLTTVVKLMGSGGSRAVIAESLLVKHQLVILNRGCERAPDPRPMDRVVAGLWALLVRPADSPDWHHLVTGLPASGQVSASTSLSLGQRKRRHPGPISSTSLAGRIPEFQISSFWIRECAVR
jgi:hypothetical protein